MARPSVAQPGILTAQHKLIFSVHLEALHKKWRDMASKVVTIETTRRNQTVKHPIFIMRSDQASEIKGDLYELQRLVQGWQLKDWVPDWRKHQKNHKLDAVELPRLIEAARTVQVIKAESWSTHEFHTKAVLVAAMEQRIDELNESRFRRAPFYADRMQQILNHVRHYPCEHWRRRSIHAGVEVRARIRLVNDAVERSIVHKHGLIVCGDKNMSVYSPAPSRGFHRPEAFKREHAVFSCHLYDYFDVERCLATLRQPKRLPDAAPLPYRIRLCLISDFFDALDLDRADAWI